MFVAVIVLHLLNGGVLMERQSEQHFVGGPGAAENSCRVWMEGRLPAIAKMIGDAKMPVTIEARCDRLT